MAASNQRNGDFGRERRRPWLQRNMALVIFIAANLLGFTGTLIVTWADTKEALRTARENKRELKKREETIHAVPHLKGQLDMHVDEFKDFRNEQRKVNNSLSEKLDHIIRKL